jgi:uncharacterized protein (TIGR00369 family)
VQGGVASTLVDVAGGMALRGHLDDVVEDGMATINLNVNYLEQATGDLTATAEVVRAGNTVGVSEVLLESETPDGGEASEARRTPSDEPGESDGRGEPVAVGTGAYRLFRS